MNVLPTVTTVTTDVMNLLKAIALTKEESKLFLIGLYEMYGAQRRPLLMMNPMPSVETACADVQQEESQREVLSYSSLGNNEVFTMYIKGTGEKNLVCGACEKKGYNNEKCWGVTGFPKWHYKYKPGQRHVIGDGTMASNSGNKWHGNEETAL